MGVEHTVGDFALGYFVMTKEVTIAIGLQWLEVRTLALSYLKQKEVKLSWECWKNIYLVLFSEY